jgi:beta-lactamase class A
MTVMLAVMLLAPTVTFAQSVTLTVDTHLERDISGLVRHEYAIGATAGQLVDIDIVQKGIDVVVTLLRPDGRVLADFDSPNGPNGLEPVTFVAPESGTFTIRIRPFETDAAPGDYTIVLRPLRAASDDERITLDRGIAPVSPLGREIAAITRSIDAQWGVYIKCLETGDEIALEADVPMETMSVIKVPILAELLHQVADGKLSLADRVVLSDDVRRGGTGILQQLDTGASLTLKDLARLMIIVSDNTATDLVLARIGGVVPVNALMRSYGLNTITASSSTKDWFAALERADSVEQFHRDDKVHLGLSSARDMGRLLERIVRGEVIDRQASAQMTQIMRNQLYSSRLPRLLPLGFRMPHKTGDFAPMVQNDVGIIEVGDKHIVTVVFTAHHDGDVAMLDEAIGRIAQHVFDYYSRP